MAFCYRDSRFRERAIRTEDFDGRIDERQTNSTRANGWFSRCNGFDLNKSIGVCDSVAVEVELEDNISKVGNCAPQPNSISFSFKHCYEALEKYWLHGA